MKQSSLKEYGYGVHWLSFVVEGPTQMAFVLYDLLFKDAFGGLQNLKQGGRGFDQIWYSLLGFKVYVVPSHGEKEYWHFEIPGQACELIGALTIQGLDDVLRGNFGNRYHYSRLDFAFDNLPFSPQDVAAAVSAGRVKSSAKRTSLSVQSSPFDPRENGEAGTHTTYFGSRKSERMIRVYDKRGFTRLEIEYKGKRADLVAKEIFGAPDVADWYRIGLSHLRDYVNFDMPWWNEFTGGVGRAWAQTTTPGEVTEARGARWLHKQVAPMLSALHDLYPEHFVKELIAEGRVKREKHAKYDLLLSAKRHQMGKLGESTHE